MITFLAATRDMNGSGLWLDASQVLILRDLLHRTWGTGLELSAQEHELFARIIDRAQELRP